MSAEATTSGADLESVARLQVASGKWQVASGKWQVASGRSTAMLMLIYLAVISGIAWFLAFVIFHVTSGAIHLLLLLAVVSGVAGLIMRVYGGRTHISGATSR
jgi:hypothetical protein